MGGHYGIGNFLFNSGGRFAEYHTPPYGLILVVDFSLIKGRIRTSFHVYPIMSDNKMIHYQQRFLNEEELGRVVELLTEKSGWAASSHPVISRGKGDVGYYLVFTGESDSR